MVGLQNKSLKLVIVLFQQQVDGSVHTNFPFGQFSRDTDTSHTKPTTAEAHNRLEFMTWQCFSSAWDAENPGRGASKPSLPPHGKTSVRQVLYRLLTTMEVELPAQPATDVHSI